MVSEEATIPVFAVDAPGASPGSSARCAGCGDCCRMVALQSSADTYRWLLDTHDAQLTDINRANAHFVVQHMHQIDIALAAQMNPVKVLQDINMSFYICDRYDAANQRCLAYDARPPMCQGFPRYGLPLTDEQYAFGLAPYPACSFWHDVPTEHWPAYVTPMDSPGDPLQPTNVC